MDLTYHRSRWFFLAPFRVRLLSAANEKIASNWKRFSFQFFSVPLFSSSHLVGHFFCLSCHDLLALFLFVLRTYRDQVELVRWVVCIFSLKAVSEDQNPSCRRQRAAEIRCSLLRLAFPQRSFIRSVSSRNTARTCFQGPFVCSPFSKSESGPF